MKKLNLTMMLLIPSIVPLLIFGIIIIIRKIFMLALPLLRNVIGGVQKRFLILSAPVSIRLLVLVSLCAICAILGKAGKEVFACVDVVLLAGFPGVCFVGLLAVLVGVMFVVLQGCVEASGFEFYFDDVFPIGYAD